MGLFDFMKDAGAKVLDAVANPAKAPGQIKEHIEKEIGVKLWDVVTGERLGELKVENDEIGPLAFSADGNTLAAADQQPRAAVRVWDVSAFWKAKPPFGEKLAERDLESLWADLAGESPTPAGHSLSITTQVLDELDASLDLAAEALARVGIGESDAFISCWASKYHYNLLRPVTYINDLIDPSWESVLETPPFPAYTSGHSNDVGASSTIMTALFGDGFPITDHTNDDRGFAPRSFSSFFEAADESAISRLYGGIHYRFDIERGVEQGRCVGRAVNSLAFRGRRILATR